MRSSFGSDALDAVLGEARAGIGQQADRLQHRVGDDRLEDVELEVALAAGERDRRVVAEHPGADHGQRLGLGRIDLARHDRGARLVLRQDQLADPRSRAGAEEADVVGDLEEAGRERVEGAVRGHHRVVRGERLEHVGRGPERAGRSARRARRRRLPRSAACVLRPVPTAVPPWARGMSSSSPARTRRSPASICAA